MRARSPYRERVAETLPLFPLGTVLMPGASLPLHIFEPRYRQLTVDLVTGAVPGTGFSIAIGLASVLVTTFATPYFAGLTGLLYVDQRIRRERYDLQLATWAAGR